ncbi:phosphoglycolate phosphatase [Piscinibacter sakaiensis]|uniref:phosphoglycolate phosphatase n=1 Tax=Piscinibacter sakaiensis TaxID=1547922 RepID=A0A0K8P2J9_PISS1|nr:phosphoglycolate phosphatase [Piscinibacter sakaiensis]GAP36843.1 phosphoglycolate phosphatase [Piscinibacter sakaiensis]
MNDLAYDIVSFDLDGTLVDTADEIAEAANRALEAHGIGRRPPQEITLLIGAGTRELMMRLLAHVMLEDTTLAHVVSIDGVLASFERHYAATAGTTARPYPGTLEALRRLQDAGLRLACVTNKEGRHARRVLEATGLAPWFELLVAGDTLPEKKPHPSVLQHVAKALGSACDRLAHVGDSAIDVASARNAGAAAWAVPYGYNAGRPVSEAGPQRLFDDLAAMAEHVLSTRRSGALA